MLDLALPPTLVRPGKRHPRRSTLTVNELAEAAGIDQATLSAMLKQIDPSAPLEETLAAVIKRSGAVL